MSSSVRRAFAFLSAAGLFASAAPAARAEPDLVVSNIGGVAFYGTVGEKAAYSASTTSCNIGTTQLYWNGITAQHPVVALNMYRLKAGRFEQIGMSWVKHSWCAADGTACVEAGGPPTCNHNASCDWLGVGCNDTYSTAHNAAQLDLGPRSEVNAYTGAIIYPFTIGWPPQGGNAIYKRLQVLTSDVQPASNPGALYCVEVHYVYFADAAPAGGIATNNASHRPISINAQMIATVVGPTAPHQPAIMFWAAQDPAVHLVSADVPNEGRFWLGSRAYDNENGTHTYEYALYNLNSHRSAAAFAVPVGDAGLSNVGFRDVPYHSGDPIDGTDWPAVATDDGVLRWAAVTGGPFAALPHPNALRWGTLYNFRFTANAPPVLGTVEVSLFRRGAPGDPNAISIEAVVPDVGTNLLLAP